MYFSLIHFLQLLSKKSILSINTKKNTFLLNKVQCDSYKEQRYLFQNILIILKIFTLHKFQSK